MAVFDPLVTDSATRGYYVVYLFSASLPEVHLSLNQGTTAVRREFKGRAREILKDRAALMRARVAEFAATFGAYDLELGSSQALPRDYEAGHAFGRKYGLNALPTEEILRTELQQIVRAYLSLTHRGGLDPSWETEAPEGEDDDAAPPGRSLTESRRYRMHRKIERNAKTSRQVKRFHGFTCQACGFNFKSTYGQIGEDFIEAHHLKPIASLEEGVPVVYNVETDFAVLCSNCHRMVHRTKNPADLKGFKLLIRS